MIVGCRLGEGEIEIVGDRLDVIAGVAVIEGLEVGVSEAEGVDSPKTLSPLFNTINSLVTVIKLPFPSLVWIFKK